MALPEPQEVLAQLQELDGPKTELAILKISKPIVATSSQSPSKRSSDVSTDAFNDPTPASLEADLNHYKVRLPFFLRSELSFSCNFTPEFRPTLATFAGCCWMNKSSCT